MLFMCAAPRCFYLLYQEKQRWYIQRVRKYGKYIVLLFCENTVRNFIQILQEHIPTERNLKVQ